MRGIKQVLDLSKGVFLLSRFLNHKKLLWAIHEFGKA